MEIKDIIPDLLDRETVQICWGVRYPEKQAPAIEDTFSAEGITVRRSECVIVYGDYSRDQIIKHWEKRGWKLLHLSGGWANGMTLEFNLYSNLPGDVPLMERRVRDVIRGQPKPIHFDYVNGWKQILQAKGKEFSEDLKIGEILPLGAPTYWDLYATVEGKEVFLGRSTPAPFPATEDEPGFFIVETQPEFAGKRVSFGLSNTTGSRGFGTTGLNFLMVFLRHSENRAKKVYIKDSFRKAQQMQKEGRKPPFNPEEAWKYADSFFESAGEIKDDIKEILGRYSKDEVKGIQYAVRQYIADGLPARVNRFPPTKPYCFVKREQSWEVAIE